MVNPSQAAWCRYLWGGPLYSPQGSGVCIQTPCVGARVHGEVYLKQKIAHRNSKLSWVSQLCTGMLGCLQTNCTSSLPRSFSVSLVDNVSLLATSARGVFEAKSLTDAEWCSDVHCIPSSAKGSGEPGWLCCELALKNRKAVDVCECAGCSWGLAALIGPKRFAEVVLIFNLNPRAEQNLRNGREGDKMS